MAQWLEYCVSSTKVVGSIPRSLWICFPAFLLCFPGPPSAHVGLMWNPQPCANPCAKTSSFSVGVGLVLSAPLQCHSSWNCTRSLQSPERPARGWSRPGSSTRAVCCEGPRTPSDEGDRTVSGPCDVHACGPGAPSLAVSGRQEGAGIVTVPACFRVADWPLRRCCRELCPEQHKSRQRRSNTSCARGNLLLPLRLQPLSLLFAVGALLRLPPLPRSSRSLPPGSVKEPVAGRTPSPFRPPPNLAASTNARGPEMGDPEMEETARREMVTAPLPPPEEGRVESLV